MMKDFPIEEWAEAIVGTGTIAVLWYVLSSM